MVVGFGELKIFDPSVPDKIIWLRSQPVQVEFSAPIGAGGVRTAYLCRLQGFPSRYVAKSYAHTLTINEDWAIANTAERIATEYNKQDPPKKVRFVIPLGMLIMNGVKYLIEEYLPGEFVKHNSIFGHILTNRRTPDAFSHFSYQQSRCRLMVLDIQGVDDTYTDPALVSLDQSYGYTDTGLRGIRDFFANHKCGELCRSLGCVPPPNPLPANEEEAALAYPRLAKAAVRLKAWMVPPPPPPPDPPRQQRDHTPPPFTFATKELAQGTVPHSALPQSESATGTVLLRDGRPWQCVQCDKSNPESAQCCRNCYATRPDTNWECVLCKAMQLAHSAHCSSCGASKPRYKYRTLVERTSDTIM
eukprot:TRINITY_DN1393_c0_g1_i1.p1 TRINITY_DN1393_c0_g1~~TRINITY_DN1393_c0_g1_i1.p1  ORF type:complete len:376 (-),score=39.28 TRINITY_DN1393_c0_g1_i1:29-1108(-)